MTLQPSEPDFMLERKEGSVVIEKPYKKEKKRKKKGRFTGRGCHPLGAMGAPESSGSLCHRWAGLLRSTVVKEKMHKGM